MRLNKGSMLHGSFIGLHLSHQRTTTTNMNAKPTPRPLLMSMARIAQESIQNVDILTICSLMSHEQLEAHVRYYWDKAYPKKD